MTATSKIATVVWGTGNVGRAAIRTVDAHPGLELTGVIVANPDKVGRDAGDLADVGRVLGVAATDDVEAVLGAGPGAVVYAASGDVRPDAAIADVTRALLAGAVVVTPSIYPLYDFRSAPADLRLPLEAAAEQAGGALFVSGIDPGWGNDILPIWLSGLAGTHRPGAVPGDLRLLHLRPARRGPLPRGHGPAHGRDPADGAAHRPHHGLGRAGPAHRPRAGRGARRDPRDPRAPPARRHGHQRHGHVRGRHPGRAPLRGAGHRRWRAPDHRRARHPHRPRAAPPTGRSRPTVATVPTAWSSRAGRASR